MLVLIIYLISILNPLNFVVALTGVVGVGGGSIFFLSGEEECREDEKELCMKNCKRFLKFGIPAVLLFILLPSKTTAYQMLAAYGVTEAYTVASESEEVQRIAEKSLQFLEETLDEQLGDTEED